MKAKLAFFIATLLMSSMVCKAQEPALDDILSSYYKAIGIVKMKNWQTVTTTGKTIAQGMEFPIKIYMKRPGKIRIEAVVQGNTMISCFDGNAGWAIIPWSGNPGRH
jgi:outer membrane lipoprotein-sorting protein